jgi:penicillin amidase
MHLSAPGWNVAGVTLPGIPAVVIGHTPHHAWGLTNAMIDDADFYLEQPDSLDPAKYRIEKSSVPFEVREEIIRVKGADSVVFTARATRHGPIVSDVHPAFTHPRGTDIESANLNGGLVGQPRGTDILVGQPRGTDILVGQPRGSGDSLRPLIAMRWTGFEVSDEVYGFYLMDKADSPLRFEEGVKEIAVPGQVVVYGDTNNVIASWTAGKIPIRGKQPAMLPMEGWTGENEWKGFIPFAQLPKTINPREGFIASANEKLGDKSFPHYISTLWEPQSRILRIRELLRTSEKLSSDDFRQFQQDVYSPYAKDVTGHLITAYRDTAPGDPEIFDALTYLRNWDYRFTQADIATSIFNTFFVRLLKNTFEDEMGEDVFHDFVFFGAIPYRVTGQLLASDTSSWFDNIGTPKVETKDEILRRSLAEGLKMLRDTLGAEMKTWRWGELHTVTFRHPFGSRKPLGSVFNIGPFPLSGGGTTVDKTEYKFTAPFSVSVGASMRQVVDLADPEHGSIVITSGQSGQPLNAHYDDQTPLWLNGGYIDMSLNWDELFRLSPSHLTLIPQ